MLCIVILIIFKLRNRRGCNVGQLFSDKRRIIWCLSWRLSSSSKTQTHEQHWSKSVSAAIFSRTKKETMCTPVCQTASWMFSALVHTMISGHKCVLFALHWHGCAWQFLTCVMSYADTETERKDTRLIGSYKVNVKLQESTLTALVQRGHTVHSACFSGSHS